MSRADTNFERFWIRSSLCRSRTSPRIGHLSISGCVEFSPPKGWIEKPAQNSAQSARFTNLTRQCYFLVAGNPVRCSNFQFRIAGKWSSIDHSAVRLSGSQASKLMTFEDVPKYQVRLTNLTTAWTVPWRSGFYLAPRRKSYVLALGTRYSRGASGSIPACGEPKAKRVAVAVGISVHATHIPSDGAERRKTKEH